MRQTASEVVSLREKIHETFVRVQINGGREKPNMFVRIMPERYKMMRQNIPTTTTGRAEKGTFVQLFFTTNFASHVSPGQCRIEMRVAQHLCLQK